MILNHFKTLLQTNNSRIVICSNTKGTYNEHYPLALFSPCLIFEVGYLIMTRGRHHREHKRSILYVGPLYINIIIIVTRILKNVQSS